MPNYYQQKYGPNYPGPSRPQPNQPKPQQQRLSAPPDVAQRINAATQGIYSQGPRR